MTLLSGATNLAEGDNIAHTQDFTKDANGATLSATLSGNVIRATAGEIGYEATGTTLNSVYLANWNGTASAVPTGWTANASGVSEKYAEGLLYPPNEALEADLSDELELLKNMILHRYLS